MEKRIFIVFALYFTSALCLSACEPAPDYKWRHVADYDESALFLDVTNVKRNGHFVTFWTKLAPASWLERNLKDTDIRTKREIDCKAKAMRDLEGGIYKNGELKTPFKKLSSGKILKGGYAILLHERLC